MRKLLLIPVMILAGSLTISAQTYLTRTGKIYFNASTKTSPEQIEAKNNEMACILDAKTGALRFQALIKSFKFEKQLMEEHFNENYLESDKFPKADFKGSITNISDINFSKDGTYKAEVSGKLTMHGVTNDITVPGTVDVQGGNVKLKAKFAVKLADYKVGIPSIVADKIGKIANISVESELTKK